MLARPELPPVTRASSVPALRIEGKRLATLGMGWLRLVCHCGHEGKVSVMQLAERHGSDIRVREAIIPCAVRIAARRGCAKSRFWTDPIAQVTSVPCAGDDVRARRS